jgi:hypothetical protein
MPNATLHTLLNYMWDMLATNQHAVIAGHGLGLELAEASFSVARIFGIFNLFNKVPKEFFDRFLGMLLPGSTLLETAAVLRLTMLAKVCATVQGISKSITPAAAHQRAKYFDLGAVNAFDIDVRCQQDLPTFLLRMAQGRRDDEIWSYSGLRAPSGGGGDGAWYLTADRAVGEENMHRVVVIAEKRQFCVWASKKLDKNAAKRTGKKYDDKWLFTTTPLKVNPLKVRKGGGVADFEFNCGDEVVEFKYSQPADGSGLAQRFVRDFDNEGVMEADEMRDK